MTIGHDFVYGGKGEGLPFTIPIEHLLFGAALFLLVSIFVSKLAVRTGVPVLLLFLLLGMIAGSDGPGGIYFDYPWLAQAVGVIALSFILFSGGLDTQWREVRLVLRPGLALATIGVTVTALAVGTFGVVALGLSWIEGILLGAIIASTDAAAVFSLLRGQNTHLKHRLKPLLELESGSNDPMAVFLTIGLTQLLVNPQQPALSLIPLFALQMGVGALAGYLVARLALLALNNLRLEYDGLYPVLTIALVLLTYGASASLGGNGFLAVYLMGLLMARQDFIHKQSLLRFHDGLAWLMQIVMFVTLGLQVFPSRLPGVAESGLLVAAFLILVARPLAVFVSLVLSRFSLREKLFVSWVGLRGAAPIVLATFPLLAGAEQADEIFHLVFFIVLTSVLIQGSLMIPLAKGLRVLCTDARQPKSPLAFVMRDGVLMNDLIEVTIDPLSKAVGKQIVDLHLPKGTLIMLIGREDDLVVPRGSTIIEADDRVLLVAEAQAREQVRSILGSIQET